MLTRKNCLIMVCLLLGSSPGGRLLAHDFWIEPQTFRPAVMAEVPIVLRVGEDFTGTSQPLIPSWFSDYTATGPTGVKPIVGYVGDDPAGSFKPDAPGNWVIGYRSTQAFVEIEPPKFNQYLRAEGLEWVIAARERRGETQDNAREIYSRCAKSLVRAGTTEHHEGFDAVLGYRLELVPERDPHLLGPGDELPVRLLFENAPLAGILVVAFTAENPAGKQQSRTDAAGRTVIQLATPGTWLIKGVHIIELPATHERAEWESLWASLTFALDAP